MKSRENPDRKPAEHTPRRAKAVTIDSDISERERRLIAGAAKGGPAETTTVRLSPILKEAAAFAMTSRGLTFTEYVNFLVARDAIRTQVDLDSVLANADPLTEPTSALDLVLDTWAGDTRRRMANRVMWLREDAFPAEQHKLVDALRSFMKAVVALVEHPVNRDQLADATLDEWDAIEASVGDKHVDRTALAACAKRAAERLYIEIGEGPLEQFTAQLRARGIPNDVIATSLSEAYAQVLSELVDESSKTPEHLPARTPRRSKR